MRENGVWCLEGRFLSRKWDQRSVYLYCHLRLRWIFSPAHSHSCCSARFSHTGLHITPRRDRLYEKLIVGFLLMTLFGALGSVVQSVTGFAGAHLFHRCPRCGQQIAALLLRWHVVPARQVFSACGPGTWGPRQRRDCHVSSPANGKCRGTVRPVPTPLESHVPPELQPRAVSWIFSAELRRRARLTAVVLLGFSPLRKIGQGERQFEQ